MDAYETFSTTADVGIRIRGRGYEELFRNAMKGLNLLILGHQPSCSASTTVHPFAFNGDSPENLLVNLLSEILFLLQNHKQVTLGINFKEISDTRLEAELLTIPADAEPELEIKSVTYHNLKIREENNLLYTEIIFDI
jgi:SHS2 domain-containing protein